MKDSGKSNRSCQGKSVDAKKDRKSATGMSGSPKKGGHGGKFTWFGDGYAPGEIGIVDARDPNFEEPEEVPEAVSG